MAMRGIIKAVLPQQALLLVMQNKKLCLETVPGTIGAAKVPGTEFRSMTAALLCNMNL